MLLVRVPVEAGRGEQGAEAVDQATRQIQPQDLEGHWPRQGRGGVAEELVGNCLNLSSFLDGVGSRNVHADKTILHYPCKNQNYTSVNA